MDIVKERADAAERELERIAASFSVASDGSGRSARVISTCSDVSVGSDEVFDGASPGVSPGLSPVLPGSPESPLKRQVIQKDWDVSIGFYFVIQSKLYQHSMTKMTNCQIVNFEFTGWM